MHRGDGIIKVIELTEFEELRIRGDRKFKESLDRFDECGVIWKMVKSGHIEFSYVTIQYLLYF